MLGNIKGFYCRKPSDFTVCSPLENSSTTKPKYFQTNIKYSQDCLFIVTFRRNPIEISDCRAFSLFKSPCPAAGHIARAIIVYNFVHHAKFINPYKQPITPVLLVLFGLSPPHLCLSYVRQLIIKRTTYTSNTSQKFSFSLKISELERPKFS